MPIEDQFSGLPIDTLIGGPLKAAAEAQAKAAKTTADFIEKVGINRKPPCIKLVPVPAFTMDEVTIDFTMEVKEKLPPED